ncbi:MAG: 50S ribosomal protein L3 [Phycisphaerae bacterium]|nr:50S ribosomal protein L3 [Phycisphaerae bacterium]
MVAALLGKKVGMTQVYDEAGRAVPVTVIQAGPCRVLQVKTEDKDGYNAVQLGYGDVKAHRSTMPQIGHAAKAGTTPKRFVRELRLGEAPVLDAEGEPQDGEARLGATWTVKVFDEVQFVDVVGTTKGRGYAGVMRRHHFGGQPASHGTERKHRSPGSISSHGSDLGHGGNLKKGKRMAGQLGNVRRTSRNHVLVGVDTVRNLLLVRGGIPGPIGGHVMVKASVTKTQPAEISRLLFVAESNDSPQPGKVHRKVVFGAETATSGAVKAD